VSASFSPDGKRILTASTDKTARLWDAETGLPIGAPFRGHRFPLVSASFSRDGKRIVTTDGAEARLWDTGTGQPTGKLLSSYELLRSYEGQLTSVSFSPDGKRVVTSSTGKMARLWDAGTGQPIGAPFRGHEGDVVSAAFSPDGKRIVTASYDKTARLWDTPTTDALIEAAKKLASRCLTPAQRDAFFLPATPPAWCIEMEKWPNQDQEWKVWLKNTRANLNPPLPNTDQ